MRRLRRLGPPTPAERDPSRRPGQVRRTGKAVRRGAKGPMAARHIWGRDKLGREYQFFGANYQACGWRVDHVRSIATDNPARPTKEAMRCPLSR